MHEFMIKAVVFDFDGTLIKTNEKHFRSYKNVFAKHGLKVDPLELIPYYGVPALKIFQDFKLKHGLKASPERLVLEKNQEYERIAKNTTVSRKALDLIKALKKRGFKVAMFTGNSLENVLTGLGEKNLNLFDEVITEENVKRPKPDPEGLKLIATALDLKTSNLAFVGDAKNDVVAAKKANSLAIGKTAALTLKGLIEEHPGIIIHDLNELKTLLKKPPQKIIIT